MRSPDFRTFLPVLLPFVATGCLNLGGKTTYVNESPGIVDRLSTLEGRVGALEATTYGRPVSAPASLHAEVDASAAIDTHPAVPAQAAPAP